MPNVVIDKKTQWECQRCGKCCHDLIIDKGKTMSIEKDKKTVCKNLDDSKLCTIYNKKIWLSCFCMSRILSLCKLFFL